jgi:hypothetical protein
MNVEYEISKKTKKRIPNFVRKKTPRVSKPKKMHLHFRKSSQFQSNRQNESSICGFWLPLIGIGVAFVLFVAISNLHVYNRHASEIDAAVNYVNHHKCAWVPELNGLVQRGENLLPENQERVAELSTHVAVLTVLKQIEPCEVNIKISVQNPTWLTFVDVVLHATILSNLAWICAVIVLITATFRLTRLASSMRLCACCRRRQKDPMVEGDGHAFTLGGDYSAAKLPEFPIFTGEANKAAAAETFETSWSQPNRGDSRFTSQAASTSLLSKKNR